MNKKSVILTIAVICVVGFIWIFNAVRLEKSENCGSDKIVVGVDTLNVSYAPLIIAEKNGYFKEQGLEVSVLSNDNKESSVSQLMAGTVDFCFANTETVLSSDHSGTDVSVVIGDVIMKDSITDTECKAVGISTSQRFLSTDSNKVQRFMNAICRAQDYVNRHASSKTAKIIQEDFPNLSIDQLISTIQTYKEEGVFSKDNLVPVSEKTTMASSDINNDYIRIYRGIDLEQLRDQYAK